MKSIFIALLLACSLNLDAQNLFPVKLGNCNTAAFCLDCGVIKAGYEEKAFQELLNRLQTSLNLQAIRGGVKFQVLVDKNSSACVLSHTDVSNNFITQKILAELNQFKKWTPAVNDDKTSERSSINIIFIINDNKITGRIERVDINAFKKTFDKPVGPQIFNKIYKYTNEHLNDYKITVWSSTNSNLPNNMDDYIAIDKDGLIWLPIDEKLVTFDGNKFHDAEQNITDKGKYFGYNAIASDNNNTKWMYAGKNIYSYDNRQWKKHEPSEIGIDGAYNIINNQRSGEVFFCSDEGLTIYKDGNWSHLNQDKVKGLPSNRVNFAKRDSKNRVWIGTFSGTVMIDENHKVTNFETTSTVLKGKCITAMDEDENGNLYFSLFEFNRKDNQKINNDEGIAIRSVDGTFKQLTTENSGMPFNHTNCVLYDKTEKVLWISTDRAGLVRYDLKDGWENYHNENSAMPTSYISTMAFDAKGNLFLATKQGLVEIERK